MFNKFRRKINSGGASEKTALQFIIAGLGNPGDKYRLSRHNVGFMTIDRLCERLDIKVKKVKFKAVVGDGIIGGERCLVMKPDTFMNNSGEALREAADFYKIPPERVIVVFDDVSLPAGHLRIRKKGSDGGHNGIKSVIYHLRSENFPRIKVGVGEKPHPEMDLAAWVLSPVTGEDEKLIASAVDRAVDALGVIIKEGADSAMNKFNG